MEEKTFVESKKWLAFAFSIIVIAVSCLTGFKLGMSETLINAMATKIMFVSLGLIFGQSGIDMAKKIVELVTSFKTSLAQIETKTADTNVPK